MVCSQTSSRTLVIFVPQTIKKKISEDAEIQLPTQIVLSLYVTAFNRVLKTFVYH